MRHIPHQRQAELPKGALLLRCPHCLSSNLRRNKKGMYICNECEKKYDLYQLKTSN